MRKKTEDEQKREKEGDRGSVRGEREREREREKLEYSKFPLTLGPWVLLRRRE